MPTLAPRLLVLISALALPFSLACSGDDDDDDGGGGVDAGDGGGVDAGVDDCDETALLPLEYRPIGSISTSELVTTADGDVTSAVIDGTAGGFIDYPDNPYLYIDLEAGVKVEIDDVDALTSDAWDIAFKRANIRLNGGDSGPGDVAVAKVDGELADVTEAPADGEFATDDWASDNCLLQPLADGTPSSAFGEWYDYDDATHILTPKAEVYVVRTRSGQLVKFVIDTYYGDDADPTRGAYYQAAWAPL